MGDHRVPSRWQARWSSAGPERRAPTASSASPDVRPPRCSPSLARGRTANPGTTYAQHSTLRAACSASRRTRSTSRWCRARPARRRSARRAPRFTVCLLSRPRQGSCQRASSAARSGLSSVILPRGLEVSHRHWLAQRSAARGLRGGRGTTPPAMAALGCFRGRRP